MPRKPLGTYVRTTADWHTTTTSTGWCYGFTTSAAPFAQMSLYNGDQHGRVLYLDAFDYFAGAATVLAYQAFGVPGVITVAGLPIFSGQNKQAGDIYYAAGPFASPPLSDTTTIALNFQVPPANARREHVQARGPLAILKPGYSYVLQYYLAADSAVYSNFYWTVLNE